MRRLEKRILRLGDEVQRLQSARDLVAEELRVHEHLDDDAQRDAAVSDHPIDRSDARTTSGDVARFRRSLARTETRLRRVEEKRDKLLSKLG